jgi:hypothetical protein
MSRSLYSIKVSGKAFRQIEEMGFNNGFDMMRQIIDTVDALAFNPSPAGAEKLVLPITVRDKLKQSEAYELYVGEWCIVYLVYFDKSLIEIRSVISPEEQQKYRLSPDDFTALGVDLLT